jgi:hypothetical protein
VPYSVKSIHRRTRRPSDGTGWSLREPGHALPNSRHRSCENGKETKKDLMTTRFTRLVVYLVLLLALGFGVSLASQLVTIAPGKAEIQSLIGRHAVTNLAWPVGGNSPPVAVQYAQNTCYTNCAAQRATCDRGCNAGGGSMLHVQACLVDCQRGQEACAYRCR